MSESRFLDPQVLARIDNLELLARTVVDGFINGLHHSPYLGLSVDFAEHRPYMPGDDIRRVDWRVFGRTDRFYVKEFEADTNANFVVLFDISKSMDYSSDTITKLDYGRYVAACLAYFSRQQRDRVGIITFDDDIVDYIPSSAKHLELVLHTLDRIKCTKAGKLDHPLLKVAEVIQRRSILVLISDLYDSSDVIVEATSRLRHKGNDMIVFQVLDPTEVDFPFQEAAFFEDIESGERIPVVPEKQRAQYQALMADHLETIGRRLGEAGVDYCLFNTASPIDYALFEYLSRRQYLSRIR